MQRRIEAGVVILVGIALLGVTLVAQLFTRAPAFERLTDDFRAPMSTSSLETLDADLTGMRAMSDELVTDVMPGMATALGMTTEEFGTFVATNFPSIATGMEQLPAIVTEFEGFASTLAGEQARFEASDEIPTASLPATTIPWGMLAAGILIIGAGILILFTERAGVYAALGVGILLIAGPLVMSLTTKASKADQMNENLRPVMTQEQAAGSSAALGVVMDMADEMQTGMIPALAEQLGMTAPEAQTYIAESFPATGAMFASMPDVQTRFSGLVATLAGNIDDYDTIKPLSLAPIVWMLMAAGLITGVAGGLGFFAPAPSHMRSRRHALAAR